MFDAPDRCSVTSEKGQQSHSFRTELVCGRRLDREPIEPMSIRKVHVAPFVLAVLGVVGTVPLYALWVLGQPLRDNGQMAIPVSVSGILIDAFFCSVVPALLLAVSAAVIGSRGPFLRAALVFAVLHGAAWLAGAYFVAAGYAVNFGNTWAPQEILVGLILKQPCTLPLMALGVVPSLVLLWRSLGRHDTGR